MEVTYPDAQPFTFASSVSVTRDNAGSNLTDADISRLAAAADEGQLHHGSRHLGVYCMWAREIQSAIEALLDAQSARKKHSRETLSSSLGLSLVLHESGAPTDADETNKRISLIQWTIGGKRGRIADLDAESRVKAIVPTGAKKNPLDLSSSYIIHPAVGVAMERVKKRDRPQLPGKIVRLTSMWRTALQAQCMPENQALTILNRTEAVNDGASSEAGIVVENCGAAEALLQCESACAFCGSNLHKQHQHQPCSSSVQNSGQRADFIQQCCMCLMFWHASCVQRLLPLLQPQQCDHIPSSSATQVQVQPSSVTYVIAAEDDSSETSFQHTLELHPDLHSCELPECFRIRAGSDQDRRTCICFASQVTQHSRHFVLLADLPNESQPHHVM